MALPGVSVLSGIPRELGTISASLATQHHEWPLATAASLLAPYRERLARQPDLDLATAAQVVESHVTPDLLQQKVYTPFLAEQIAFPPALLSLFGTKKVKCGVIPSLNTVWVSSPQRTLFWDLSSNEVQEFALAVEGFGEIVNITGGSPNREVFSSDVQHVLVVSSAKQMVLVAVDKHRRFVSTELSIAIDGEPLVAVSPQGGVFFTTVNTKTTLFEFKYHAKEGWFRSKSEKACYNSSSGIFAKLAGPSSSETVTQLVVDELRGIYALTSHNKLLVFSYASSPSLVKTFTPEMVHRTAQRVKSAPAPYRGGAPNSGVGYPSSTAYSTSGYPVYPNSSSLGYAGVTSGYPDGSATKPIGMSVPAVNADNTNAANTANIVNTANSNTANVNNTNSSTTAGSSVIVSIAAVSAKDSQFIRLVAVTSRGDRLYFRCPNVHSDLTFLELAHVQPLSTSPATLAHSRVYHGSTTYAVTQTPQGAQRLLAAMVDTTRIAFVADQPAMIPFVELCGWLDLDSNVQAVDQINDTHYTLTETSVYRLQRRPFSDRFEYADVPLALIPVYGAMQLCEGAFSMAARPQASRIARENAIAAFFRFGGGPVFMREPLPSGFLGTNTIRLSASFDGLASLLARTLLPIWDQKILGTAHEIVAPSLELLDSIYEPLTGIVNLLNRNRSFSEGMSERSASVSGDDAAVLSQAEYRGLFAMARLARSSQEGIAFLRLSLTQNSVKHLLSYFDPAKMPGFRAMTYGEFFTQAKSSLAARELVNSLVNYVLSRGESVDAIAGIIQDRCASYCSAADVLEYKALEYIHRAKQSKPVDTAMLAKSVTLVRKAAASIQLETLRDIIKDYVDLQYYVGAVQAALAVAAEQDPANLAVGYLRANKVAHLSSADSTAENLGGSATAGLVNSEKDLADTYPYKRIAGNEGQVVPVEPLSESERNFRAKMAVFSLVFTEVLAHEPRLADAGCADPAHAAMLNSTDEVWHFALYDWYLVNRPPDQIALLDTPFVATYLELGASRDLRVADLLWKWHQRHNDLLAAADVLLDLARGPLVPTLSTRVAYLSRAQGYAQAQDDQHTLASVNMLAMVRAYLNLALIQTDILNQLEQRAKGDPVQLAKLKPLHQKILTISELYNEWAQVNGLYEVCFAIFAFADLRDPVEIQTCWSNLLTAARAEDGAANAPHYLHVAELMTRIGQNFRSLECIFPVPKLVPMLEQYATDYCSTAPRGWIVDAFVRAGLQLNTLRQVYVDVLSDRVLEGPYYDHAAESLEYIKELEQAKGGEQL